LFRSDNSRFLGDALAMSRTPEWTPAAERDLRRLDVQVRERIRQAVYRFADTGHGDVVKVQGVAREWRLRAGHWRIRFTEHSPGQTIILRVRPRGRLIGEEAD
jgi:mRNA-degrading endonuclease RelE of RelBE toxin-antitoxin system